MRRRGLVEYGDVAVRAEALNGRLDFAELFGRSGKVHVEVGSGKGTFLVHEATAHPEADFLGIEWARKYYLFAVDRMGRRGIRNVRLVRAEAAGFIAEHIADGSVDCFHIYFPDPWPKKRHHKRRFVQAGNVEQLVRCLKAGGTIRIATDHAEYFSQIDQVMGERRDALEPVHFLQTAGADAGEWVGTNFERKYIMEGREFFTLAVRKVTG